MISGVNSSYTNFLQQAQSTQQKQGPPDLFNALDEDGSGGINQSELDTWAKTMSDVTGQSIDTTQAITTYDTDGDGALSSTELKSFLDSTGIKPPEDHSPDLFNALDSDGSGGISQSELDTWAKDMSGVTGKTIDTSKAISTYDADGDGVLNSTELKSYLDSTGIKPPAGDHHHDQHITGTGSTSSDTVISGYDTNGDGVLSGSELQKFLDDIGQSSSPDDSTIVQQALSAYISNMSQSASAGSASAAGASINLSVDFSG
jgi:Ca2+-binding EF-hand superfamily protein